MCIRDSTFSSFRTSLVAFSASCNSLIDITSTSMIPHDFSFVIKVWVTILFFFLFTPQLFVTVSYTHLDVYKRQWLYHTKYFVFMMSKILLSTWSCFMIPSLLMHWSLDITKGLLQKSTPTYFSTYVIIFHCLFFRWCLHCLCCLFLMLTLIIKRQHKQWRHQRKNKQWKMINVTLLLGLTANGCLYQKKKHYF